MMYSVGCLKSHRRNKLEFANAEAGGGGERGLYTSGRILWFIQGLSGRLVGEPKVMIHHPYNEGMV